MKRSAQALNNETSSPVIDDDTSSPAMGAQSFFMNTQRLKFSLRVVEAVNPHFSKRYENAPNDYLRHNDLVVYRPNHSLAHGLRQAYLAVDIAVFIKNMPLSDSEKNSPIGILQKWILEREKTDPRFLEKVEYTNAFQRSGRQSDISKDTNPELYAQYLKNDQENFRASTKDGLGAELFDQGKNEKEINLFAQALVEKFNLPLLEGSDLNLDLVLLSKIFYTAHVVDLRRLPHFDKSAIKNQISMQLFEINYASLKHNWQIGLIDKLWTRAGDYLMATGDRDMDIKGSDFDKDVFCAQAHNPSLMVGALQSARTKPEKTLFQSITNHARTIRKLKEKFRGRQEVSRESFYTHTQERKQKIADLQQCLNNSFYTASEGSLQIELGDAYIPINEGDSLDIVREKTTTNVINFLKDKNRVENPDSRYVNTLVECMLEERKNKGKIVFYHATEPEMGFVYDVFTQILHQLMLEGGNEIKALRAIHDAFLKLDENSPHKANVRDFMRIFNDIADDNEKYRDLMLSTNFSLFGSDQQLNADTYYMFYKVKDKKVVTQELDYANFFNYVMQKTYIPGDYDKYKQIFDKFVARNEQGMPWRNGRMIQIFVDPEVLVDMAYFSVLLGAPVLKGSENEEITPDLDEPIKLLRSQPDKLKEYLTDTRGKILAAAHIHQTRPGPLKLHDLQARLFMRPEVMFNADLVDIKSYWRLGLPNKGHQAYIDEISKVVNTDLVTWLHEGAPVSDGVFVPGTVKLKKFSDTVYLGSTGMRAPIAPPPSLQVQLISILQANKYEQAVQFISQHFDQLRDAEFFIQPNRNGRNGGTFSLEKLLLIYMDPKILEMAFHKGIFKGGEKAYKLSQLVGGDNYDLCELLNTLSQLTNLNGTIDLYNKHFYIEKSKSNSSGLNELLLLLDKIDESLILIAKPLIKMLNADDLPWRILEAINSLPSSEREEAVNLACNYYQQQNSIDPQNSIRAKHEIHSGFMHRLVNSTKRPGEEHCPDKLELRLAIDNHEWECKWGMENKQTFDFCDKTTNKVWTVAYSTTLPELDKLRLDYETNSNKNGYLAQFYRKSDSLNKLVSLQLSEKVDPAPSWENKF